jgi:hypothetical protein
MLLDTKTLIICHDAKPGTESDAGRRIQGQGHGQGQGQGQGQGSGGVIGVMLRVYAAPNKQLDNLDTLHDMTLRQACLP